MKLNDVVYYVSEKTITKTRIKGIQDLLEKPRFSDKEVRSKKYYVRLHNSAAYSSNNSESEWVVDEHPETGQRYIFATLEEAQKVITEQVQREILDELSKITVIDLAGPVKEESQDDELRQ